MWLLINSGCQMDVSAMLPVPDRVKLVKAVVQANKARRGEVELTPQDLLNGGALGLVRMK